MRFSSMTAGLLLAAGLCACSSSGTGGAPGLVNPVQDPQGGNAPPANFVMTDISYGHPGSSDGVDEDFDLAVTTMHLDIDQNNGALVHEASVRGFFGQDNTMTYDAGEDSFTFVLTSGDSALNATFDNVMLTDPVDVGFEYNNEAIVISSNPSLFAGFGFDQSFSGDPQAVNAYLQGLADSDDEADGERLSAIQQNVSDYVNRSDYYYYDDGAVSYSHLQLNNAAITTNYTTLGIWEDHSVAGEVTIGVAVWGARTPRYEVPVTGTASYTAAMAGQILQNNNTQFLTGSINFDFDFAAQLVDFTMDADIAETGIDGTTDYFDYDTFTGSGNVYVDTFLGDFVSDSDETITGELEGAFFGADADEVAGTFVFGNENVHGIGGFVGANPESTSQQN